MSRRMLPVALVLLPLVFCARDTGLSCISLKVHAGKWQRLFSSHYVAGEDWGEGREDMPMSQNGNRQANDWL